MPESLLDDLAHDAPLPGPGFTDAVIAAGRRRVRRGRAALGAAIGVVVVALAVPAAVQLGRTDVSAPPGAIASSATEGIVRVAPSPHPSSSIGPVELEVDIALVRHIEQASGPSVKAIEIRSSICANADQPTYSCTGARPFTAAMQQQILAGVASHHPIRFVTASAQLPPGSAGPDGQTLFLTLGAARITGNSATAFVQSWCGFSCVRGDEYILGRRSGGWQVTGSSGGYVS